MEIASAKGFALASAPRQLTRIGVVVPCYERQFSSYYIADLMNGISDSLMVHQEYLLSIVPRQWIVSHQGSLNVFLRDRELDALLILHSTSNDYGWIGELAKDHIPHIVTGNRPPAPANWVDSDNLSAAKDAVTYLIQLGHKQIAFIGGAFEFQNHRDRFAGYRTALEEAGLPISSDLVVTDIDWDDMKPDAGSNAAKRVLSTVPSPTAIYAMNDHLACGVHTYLLDQGLQPGREISLLSNDDSDLVANLRPALSAIRQPIYQLGKLAARRLVELLRGSEQTDLPVQEVLGSRLIIRDTTGPVVTSDEEARAG